MRLRFFPYSLLSGFLAAASCLAQGSVSIGVKGGIPLTDPFRYSTDQQIIYTVRTPFFLQQITQTNEVFNGPRAFVIGPTLEFALPLHLAVEADALYRPLQYRLRQTTSSPFSTIVTLPVHANAWEFPIVAKYRLPVPLLKPYFTAGPAFRAVSSNIKHMSGTGVAAGIGVETRIGPLLVSPEVRYTHWSADHPSPAAGTVTSYQNQVEALMGVASRSESSTRLGLSPSGWKDRLLIGVKGGLPFTTAFISDEYGRVSGPSISCGDFTAPPTPCLPVQETVESHRASRNYLVGPTVEVRLSEHFSLEGDALYNPLSLVPPPSQWFYLPMQTFNSWSFPIVGKYRFPVPLAQPYLEAGPTFRTASSVIGHYLSRAGVTAGIGIETEVWKLHFSPEVRFIHWNADAPDAGLFYASRRNQAQFLIGLAY
jgi:hypothetical protein